MPGVKGYKFGLFRFEVAGQELSREDTIVHLTPKESGVLLLLLQKAGKTVEREDFFSKVWPDVYNPDRSLNRAISVLRKVLSDGRDEPEYIATASKKGYRFVFPVTIIGDDDTERTGDPRIMLAVLPFQNLIGAEDEYFVDGLTAQMITQLGRLNPERLGVIAWTSAMQYKNTNKVIKQIGEELGVAFALEGNVRRAGSQVCIAAQLVAVRDQTLIWAEEYEEELVDILILQGKVAKAIADQIRIALTPQEEARLQSPQQVNPPAYLDYSKGRYLWNKRTPASVLEASGLFEKAILQEPTFALAYSALADCYAVMGSQSWIPPREASAKGAAAATKALEIDNTLAEPHATLGFIYTVFEYRWQEAEKEFHRALAINPNYATAHHWHSFYLAAMGRVPEAIEEINSALGLDPLSRMINTNVGTMLYWARKNDAAIEQCRKALSLDPDFWNAHNMLALVLEQKKQFKAAIAEHRRAIADFPGRSALLVASLARTCALSGAHREARDLLQELNKTKVYPCVAKYQVGLAHAALGETGAAFRCLRQSIDAGEMWVGYMKVDPRMDDLRRDRRYRELLKVTGLKD
jgi:TolB-like protein/Flp pilus assembly protein TadD